MYIDGMLSNLGQAVKPWLALLWLLKGEIKMEFTL